MMTVFLRTIFYTLSYLVNILLIVRIFWS